MRFFFLNSGTKLFLFWPFLPPTMSLVRPRTSSWLGGFVSDWMRSSRERETREVRSECSVDKNVCITQKGMGQWTIHFNFSHPVSLWTVQSNTALTPYFHRLVSEPMIHNWKRLTPLPLPPSASPYELRFTWPCPYHIPPQILLCFNSSSSCDRINLHQPTRNLV